MMTTGRVCVDDLWRHENKQNGFKIDGLKNVMAVYWTNMARLIFNCLYLKLLTYSV